MGRRNRSIRRPLGVREGTSPSSNSFGSVSNHATLWSATSSIETSLWPGRPASPPVAEGTEPGTVPGPVILESENLQAEFEVLRARGVTFEESEPVKYPFGVRITALDPDGNRVSLRQQPRRSRAGS
jgi:hypothetical protein